MRRFKVVQLLAPAENILASLGVITLMAMNVPHQEFMEGAGNNGVMLAAMGTVATLGEHPRLSMMRPKLFMAC